MSHLMGKFPPLRTLLSFLVRTSVIGSLLGAIEYLLVLTFGLRQPLQLEESFFSFANLLFATLAYGVFFVLGCSVFLILAAIFNGLCKRTVGISFMPHLDAPQAAFGSAAALIVFMTSATWIDWAEWNIMKLANLLLPLGHLHSGFLPSAALKFLLVAAFAPLFFKIRIGRRILLYGSCSVVAVGMGLILFHSIPRRESATHPENAASLPNVLLIVSDALRADHLPCYENDRVNTPNIDRLASEGAVFANAFVQAPVTGASLASLFTGLYPIHHGVLTYFEGPNKANPTLAEILRANGYTTAAIISNMMGDYRAFGRGFEHYDDLFFSPGGRSFHARLNGLTLSMFLIRSDWGTLGHYHPERAGNVTADLAIEFLRKAESPFFLVPAYYGASFPVWGG